MKKIEGMELALDELRKRIALWTEQGELQPAADIDDV